ncbi:MAG: AMP nucleosidase [Bacteroidetes bacterium]|nr:AMP nucleosidase [Bacteroidota bacterium]
MKTKKEIVEDWLPRYTGTALKEYGDYILLTNFSLYLDLFAKWQKVPIKGAGKAMPSATSGRITMINFGLGSPNAATIMDLLGAVKPKACLFLGKCGGLKKKNKLGDLILPIAAIRGDGTSDDYFPERVPALPAFNLQKIVSTTVVEHKRNYWTGTVYTTNRRVWEYDEEFKAALRKTRAMAIDMETATIFTVGFANNIPTGAVLLVSDQPMVASGIKTQASDKLVSAKFTEEHLRIGIETLNHLISQKVTVKHLRFD